MSLLVYDALMFNRTLEAKMKFTAWLSKVDRLLIARNGRDTSFWPEVNYFSMYESGATPEQCMQSIMRAASN
jgi:hypothetical protein